MKQSKFLSCLAIIMVMLFSCNSGGNESTTSTNKDSSMKDSTAMVPPPPPPTPAPPVMTMLIKQKVANFAKWFPGYEAHDSMRVAYGLHNFVVARGIKDSNTVMVALHVDDTAKAKQFSMSPGLMDAMKKAGVMGKPTFIYTENRFHDVTTDASTERAIINFKVKDYDTWEKVFDGDKQDRMNAGITDRAISQYLGDPHMVSLVMAITDMKKAEDFMHTKELKHRMDSAGVVGPPDVFFYHVVKQYQ
ncbi:MAG: hypothetical protein ABI472_06635 [Ginsengibacter sp.]